MCDLCVVISAQLFLTSASKAAVGAYHSSLGWRMRYSTMALPLTPLQPVTNATFGVGNGMTAIQTNFH